jgi:hypothetical protein
MIKTVGIKIFVLAIFLRILVSMFLFHPDIKTINFQVSFLKQGITNIYPYLIENRPNLQLKEEFVYFPLTYFLLGSYHTITSTLLGTDFDNWVKNADSYSIVNNSNIFYYLLFLKLPLLFVDILIAYLLYSYFKDQEKKKEATIFWLFNPFTIFLIYAYSNIDIYASLLVFASVMLFKNKKILLSSLFLGFAISFKLYPLLFVPFFFLSTKEIKEKILFLIIPILTFLVSIALFLSKSFVDSALLSGLSTRILTPNFSISTNESVIVSLSLISVLFFTGLSKILKISLLKFLTVTLIIIFSFTHFHISWLLWLAPFFIILVVKYKDLRLLILIWSVITVSIPLLYPDRSMTISLFRTYSTWFDLLPTPYMLVNKFFDINSLQSIIRSILIGLSFVLSINIIKTNEND